MSTLFLLHKSVGLLEIPRNTVVFVDNIRHIVYTASMKRKISLYISQQQYDALGKLIDRSGLLMSEHIRRAISEYLENRGLGDGTQAYKVDVSLRLEGSEKEIIEAIREEVNKTDST